MRPSDSRPSRPSLSSRLSRWLRHFWLDRLPVAASSRESRPTRRWLQLEGLEDRTVPSTTLIVAQTAPTAAMIGQDFDYSVTLSNTGLNPAANVSLGINYAAGSDYVSQSQTSGPSFSATPQGYTGGSGFVTSGYTYALSSLPAGDSATFDATLLVDPTTSNGAVMTDMAYVSTTTTLSGSSNTGGPLSTVAYTWSPVTVTNPGTKSSTEGGSPSVSISASDSIYGSTLTYAATGLPPGLAINSSTGAISGTVGTGAAANGPYTTTVIASDGSFSGQTTFTWNVASPITLTNPGTQSNAEGGSVSVTLSGTDSISGSTLTYSAFGLPTGLKISSAGVITGTVAAGAAANGPYQITATAQDGTYASSQTFTWNVSAPLTLNAIADQTNLEGGSVSLTISGADTTSGATPYFTTLGLPPGLHLSATGSMSGTAFTDTISGTLAAGASADGPYSVTVVANDGTSSASQSFNWNVNDAIVFATTADQTTNAGSSGAVTISATDAYSGTLTYGAVGLPTGLSINPSSGAISGTVSSSASGAYPVALLAEDGTYSGESGFTWNVNTPVTVNTPADQSNNEGDSVSLTVTASGSGTLSYSASGLPNGLSINSSSGVVSGTISYGGSWLPAVTVSNGTSTSSTTFNWSVSGPITITDSGAQQFNAGDAVSVPITATDTSSGTLSYSASGLPSGLSISSSTGLISGTISTGVSAGISTTTISVGDGTHTSVDTFTWALSGVSPVVVTNPGTKSNAEGASVSWSVSASDSVSGSALHYAASGLPAGLTINTSSGAITGTVASGDSLYGPYTVTVTATDGTNNDSQNFTYDITGPITLSAVANQTTTEGSSVSLSLSASYSGSGSLTYSALGLPPGLTINSSTGAITGTAGIGDAANGPYDVTVQAQVGAYAAQQNFTWTITSPITLALPTDQTTTEGSSGSLSLSATDSISGSTLAYSALGLPPGLKISSSTGAISGTVAGGAAANGPYSVTVIAEDGTYSTAQTFNWNVTSPISITVPADQTNNEGDSVSLSISASDSTSGTLRYAAVGLPQGLVISATTGTISGTLAVGAAVNGPYTVTVGAGDGTYSDTEWFTWNVNSPITINTPDDQTNNAGDTVSLAVVASGGGTLSYSATGLPSGLSINSSTGVVSGTLSAGGFWQPTVTAGDGTYTNNTSFNWYAGSPIVINDPGDQSNTVGDTVSLPVVATDSASGTLTYSISGLPSGLSISSSTGLISGTITGSVASSPYTTTINVTDGTRTDTDTVSWYVYSAGPVVVGNPGNLTNAAGDMAVLQIQAIDTGNAPLHYAASGLPSGLYVNPLTGFLFGTIASGAASGSPYSVTVTATDPASNSASQTFSWTINAAGTVTVTNPGDQTNNEGDTVSLSVTSNDSGSGTMRYVAFGLPAGLAISTSTGAISGTVAIGAAANGPYTVTIVANDGTYAAAQTFLWTVNSPVALALPDDQTNTEGDTASLSLTATDSVSGATLSYAALGLPPGLKINAATGAITGTVAKGAAAYGSYSVTVAAEDGTYSTSQTFNWNVNSPITITVPDDQSNNDGDSVSLTLAATDAISGTTLVYSVQGLPPGLSLNSSTGAVTGTLATGDSMIGSYFPTIIVSDGTYYSSTYFEWDINGAISIADPGAQANVVGDTVSLAIGSTDTASGTLTYGATGLPNGLSINTSTGLISGTVGSGATAIGSFTTTVTFGDGINTATDTFNWTITGTGTITLTTPSNQTSTEGNSASLSLSATDSITGSTLKYFATGLPFGLKINPGTGAITGTVATNDAAFGLAGTYSVMVLATDGTYSASETFIWTVNSPITFSPVANPSNNEGDTVSVAAGGGDSISGSTLKYGAIGLPDGLSINTGTGAITGSLALGTAATGSFAVTILANDGTYSSSQTITWGASNSITFTQQLSDQTDYEGDSLTGLSVSATDSGVGTIRYSAIDLPPGVEINPTTGAFTGTVSALATADGPSADYAVTVIASDGTDFATQVFDWTIDNPITIMAMSFQTLRAGDSVSLQIVAKDVRTGTTLTYVGMDEPAGINLGVTSGAFSNTVDSALSATGYFDTPVFVSDGSYTARTDVNWAIEALGIGTYEGGQPSVANSGTAQNDPSKKPAPNESKPWTLAEVKEILKDKDTVGGQALLKALTMYNVYQVPYIKYEYQTRSSTTELWPKDNKWKVGYINGQEIDPSKEGEKATIYIPEQVVNKAKSTEDNVQLIPLTAAEVVAILVHEVEHAKQKPNMPKKDREIGAFTAQVQFVINNKKIYEALPASERLFYDKFIKNGKPNIMEITRHWEKEYNKFSVVAGSPEEREALVRIKDDDERKWDKGDRDKWQELTDWK